MHDLLLGKVGVWLHVYVFSTCQCTFTGSNDVISGKPIFTLRAK